MTTANTNNTNNTLRQAKNVVEIVGTLKEKTIEIKQYKDKKTNEIKNFIKGRLLISVGDNEIEVRNDFIGEYDKSGRSKAFHSWEVAMREYVSQKEASEQGTTATRIHIKRGEIEENNYYSAGKKQVVSQVQIKSNFVSTAKDDLEDKATFDVEMYIQSIKDEKNNGEETGRAIVNAIIPLYGGKVLPISFVATKEASEFLKDNFSNGQTTQMWGKVVNTAKVDKKIVKGFAGEKVEETVTYVREFLIENGLPEAYDEESSKAYKKADIETGVNERASMLLEVENKGIDYAKNKGKNNNTGGATKPQFGKTVPNHLGDEDAF